MLLLEEIYIVSFSEREKNMSVSIDMRSNSRNKSSIAKKLSPIILLSLYIWPLSSFPSLINLLKLLSNPLVTLNF